MKKIILLLLISLLVMNCSIPQKLNQGEPVDTEIIGNKDAEQKLLIVSSDSEYKQAIIQEIKNYAKDKDYYLKITGLNQLKSEKVDNYTKIIVINTCLAWGMEYAVQDFLKANDSYENILIVTTSGDGGWLPKDYVGKLDAVATASKMVDLEKTCNSIFTFLEK